MKRYTEALDDLNSAIEADPTLSEAYLRRASLLRQICRCVLFASVLLPSLAYSSLEIIVV